MSAKNDLGRLERTPKPLDSATAIQRRAESPTSASQSVATPERVTIDAFSVADTAPALQLEAFDDALSRVHQAVAQHSAGGAGVQMASTGKANADATSIHAAAAQGTRGAHSQLPFERRIQASFGRHDISTIKAHTGSAAREANTAIGSMAYAAGNHVAFRGAPDLFTAAHEAAHVVQQRGGVQLRDGVGQAGDQYERHADEVATQVVQGKSAEGLLDKFASGSPSGGVQRISVQRIEDAAPAADASTAEGYSEGMEEAFGESATGGAETTTESPEAPATESESATEETGAETTSETGTAVAPSGEERHKDASTFVKSSAVKFSPDGRTERVVQAVFSAFRWDDGVIGGWLSNGDQYWKVNWHIELMVTRIDEALAITEADYVGSTSGVNEPTKFHSALQGVRGALDAVKSPVTGFLFDKAVGDTQDVETSEDKLKQRYEVMKAQKRVLLSTFASMKPWEYFDQTGRSGTGAVQLAGLDAASTPYQSFSLAGQPVALPGKSVHGQGYALDIKPAMGDGSKATLDQGVERVKADARRAGATVAFAEVNHVHCEFPNVK